MSNGRLGLRTRPGTIFTYTQVSVGDPDANAFISAAGLTNDTQKNAINQLVVDLKAYSIWSKMKAIYPFVGGLADTHKWNLKDARDLDTAFRLVFNGGITHSSNGISFNGTTGYGNTYFKETDNLSLASTHLSIYSRTQRNNTASIDIGAEDTNNKNFDLFLYYANPVNAKGFIDGAYPNNFAFSNNSNTVGMLIGTRTANNVLKIFFNNSLLNTNTNTKTAQTNLNVFIGATNAQGTASTYAQREYAFASIGDGLTDQEAADLYIAVQAFQTTLGRQV